LADVAKVIFMFERDTVIITGGSSGLGKLLAERLLAQGARVALLARDAAKLDAARDRLLVADADRLARIAVTSCDVTDPTAVQSAFAGIAERLGPPTFLINSAGVLQEGRFQDLPLDVFRKQIDINLFGTVHCIKAVLPYLERAGSGRIVNVGSMASVLGAYGYSAYCASKHALAGLSSTLRMELLPHDIHVHLVCPPEFESPMVDELNRYRSAENRLVVQSIPPMRAEEVADAILVGVRKGRYEIIPGAPARIVRLSDRLFPGLSRSVTDSRIRRARRQRSKTLG
jgi:3-dehydrosphinganine reductase